MRLALAPGRMTLPLKLLLIEDSEPDAHLVIRALEKAGYDITARRVETADGLHAALNESPWDLAIADYTMPSFSGIHALDIVREHGLDLPFIFVSGTIGEDVAVAAMRTGAHDYLIKGNLARLAPAVERELREAAVRRERTRANERVAYLAYHDPLTELPNRALLTDRLQQAILAAKRDHFTLALLVLDLDGFKEINDTLGHHAGDHVLQQIASRLRKTLRESDTVARTGGDEFAVLLPATGTDGATMAARKILRSFEPPVIVEGRPLAVHGSIGIALFPAHGSTHHDLLQKADVAMYLAKNERAGFTVYSGERDRHTEQRLSVLNSLRHAIEVEQFVLDYQPIVNLGTNDVIAVEALLRWDHPEHGRLMPEQFIQLAEHSGLINRLTMFAIDRALSEWTPAPDATPLIIGVNVSPISLHDPDFPRRIKELIDEHDAPASALALEITENVIVSDLDRSVTCLSQVHDMGVQLIVDDFGTGYSSLSYLRRLPVNQLKIDKSFVIGMAAGEDEALVRSIIDLAHNLRMRVIAEGVENEKIRDRLRVLGCDAAQGHFICRPAPAEEIKQWLEQRTRGKIRRMWRIR